MARRGLCAVEIEPALWERLDAAVGDLRKEGLAPQDYEVSDLLTDIARISLRMPTSMQRMHQQKAIQGIRVAAEQKGQRQRGQRREVG